MDEFEQELKLGFLEEARDLLVGAEKSFLELEKSPEDIDLINTIFRFAHNLKGTSRAVGLGQIAELTHEAENLLLSIKDSKIKVNDQVVSVLLTFSDKVREMLEGLSADLNATFDYNELLGQIIAINTGKVAEPVAEIAVVSEEVEAVEEVTDQPVAKKVEVKKEQRKEDETLRVSLSRLERLNNLVGELVILQTFVETSLRRMEDAKTARSLGKLCKDIQDLSMSLRMVPVGPTFQKLSRTVRDTSKLLGKKIDLRLIGEETEIDKNVIESLGDPLVHIIRNAIDHGVETPEERMASGKSEEGVVEVMAFHEGNFLIIQITDDGKGINAQTLINKAKKKGIIGQNVQLTEQQGIELIFHPGFSTKEEVSEVSGRGVGMDVVKTNIESLGGEVKVRSKVGSGSCFRLMLPLTLAIIEGMLVECGSQTYVIPKNQVQEVYKLENKDISRVTGRVPYLRLRSEVIPLFYLENELGSEKCENNIAVIVRHGDHSFGVAIKDVLRLQQVVVKPVTKEINGKVGVMGTTILSDGKPSLIIDLINLFMKRVKKESVELNKVA